MFSCFVRTAVVVGAGVVLYGCATELKDKSKSTKSQTLNTGATVTVQGTVVADPVRTNAVAETTVAAAAPAPVLPVAGDLPEDAVESPEKHQACMRAARSLNERYESYCKTGQDGEEVCQWLYTAADGSSLHHQGAEEDCDKPETNHVPMTCDSALARL